MARILFCQGAIPISAIRRRASSNWRSLCVLQGLSGFLMLASGKPPDHPVERNMPLFVLNVSGTVALAISMAIGPLRSWHTPI